VKLLETLLVITLLKIINLFSVVFLIENRFYLNLLGFLENRIFPKGRGVNFAILIGSFCSTIMFLAIGKVA